MKKILTALILFASLALINGCSQEGNAETTKIPVKRGTAVSVKLLKSETFREYLNLTGVVKASSQVQLVAEESGILVKVIKDKGSYVRKGEILGLIENKVTKAASDQAFAGFKQAEINFKSSKILYDKKAISENEYLTSELTKDAAKAAYDLANARNQKLTVKAPIKGYVNERYVDLGGYIAPSAPLFEIIDNNILKVRIGVAERFISYVKTGSEVLLSFDSFPDLVINSKISFVAKSVDPENRTFGVETEFKNPGMLAAEMISNVRLLKQNHENSIIVPIDAVIDSEAGRYVFVEKNEIAHKKKVSVEAIQGENVLVNGLQAGNNLIVAGQRSLSNGDTLYVVK